MSRIHIYRVIGISASLWLVSSGASLGADPIGQPFGITAIQARGGVVAARDRDPGSKVVLAFRVTDAAALRTLAVGQTVYADTAAQKVSIDGTTLCCDIIPMPANLVASPEAAPKTTFDIKDSAQQ